MYVIIACTVAIGIVAHTHCYSTQRRQTALRGSTEACGQVRSWSPSLLSTRFISGDIDGEEACGCTG